jgi:hypothetical protein
MWMHNCGDSDFDMGCKVIGFTNVSRTMVSRVSVDVQGSVVAHHHWQAMWCPGTDVTGCGAAEVAVAIVKDFGGLVCPDIVHTRKGGGLAQQGGCS